MSSVEHDTAMFSKKYNLIFLEHNKNKLWYNKEIGNTSYVDTLDKKYRHNAMFYRNKYSYLE